ncbi:MAG: ribonuclease HII [Actinocrinis sp.]
MGIPLPPTIGDGQGLYAYEQALRAYGFSAVAGADEAGRGACAGPLVAGAVILPPGLRPDRLNDSKLMTAAARDKAYEQITAGAAWSVAIIPAVDVDRIGVQAANYAALRQAVAGLSAEPAYVLFDGFAVPGVPVPSQAVVKGDRLAACVSAASVIAKVTRDRIMIELHETHPVYGFAAHKGYSTAVHQAALDEHGPCPEHRFSYANVPAARREGEQRPRGTGAAIVGQNGEGSVLAAQGDLLDPGILAGAGSRARLDFRGARE